MRNLEDCKAEIFRRSEERIKERKRNRNRVLVCCVPLCLLLVAGGLYLRPLFEPVDELGGIHAVDTAILDRELGGLVDGFAGSTVSYTSVEIWGKAGDAEASREVTDVKTVGELSNLIAAFFDVPTLKMEVVFGGMNGKESFGSADYVLAFKNASGEENIFRLRDNYLCKEENGDIVYLSDAQLAALKEQLDSAK